MKGVAASEDKTYSTVTANGVEGTFYLVRGNVKVAMAPVVAVRYRTSSLKDGSYFEIFADSSANEPGTGSNVRADFVTDGEWHVIVIDMAETIKRFNGEYVMTLRMDLFNKGETNQTIDYSFIGFFTDTDSAYKYFGLEPENPGEDNPGEDTEKTAWTGGEIANDFIENAQITEGISAFDASADGTYTTLTAGAREGVVYRFRGDEVRSAKPVIAVRYRTSELADDAYFEIFTDSENDGIDGTKLGSSTVREAYINDGEWHDIIIDLTSKIAIFDGKTARYLRVDLINRGVEGQTIDYSFIGFFDTLQEAQDYMNAH